MKDSYTIQDFQKRFPDNNTCLDYLFHALYGNAECPACGRKGQYHRRKEASDYVCNCGGHQVSPKAGTIFEKSRTDLYKWFYAIFLMSQSRNGVAAKEIQRHTGVTYKTAWRMALQIRAIMQENAFMLFGDIEADDTYIGGKRRGKRGRGAQGKTIVFGQVERKGKVKAEVVENLKTETIKPKFEDNIAKGSKLMPDEFQTYKKLADLLEIDHETVEHGKKEYARGHVHTNTIEGFWSQLKRSLDGTHHVISPKYLSFYVSQFQFAYNHGQDDTPLFEELLKRVFRKPV